MAITKCRFDCAPTKKSVDTKINFIPEIETDGSQLTEVKWEFKDRSGAAGAVAIATYNAGI